MKSFGAIFVDEIVDNPDGSATVHMTISDETRTEIMEHYGWTEWSKERFEQIVLDALKKAAEQKTKEDDNVSR